MQEFVSIDLLNLKITYRLGWVKKKKRKKFLLAYDIVNQMWRTIDRIDTKECKKGTTVKLQLELL